MRRDIVKNKKNGGMTLVELLIVVAIVGILASFLCRPSLMELEGTKGPTSRCS